VFVGGHSCRRKVDSKGKVGALVAGLFRCSLVSFPSHLSPSHLSPSQPELNQFRFHFAGLNQQLAYTDGQVEAPGSGAAWIEIQDAVFFFGAGLVTVPGYDDTESSGFGLEIKLCEIVQHIDCHAASRDYLGCWQRPRPRPRVDVAANCGYGRNVSQGFQNFGSAYVAGVEDLIASAQDCYSFRPQ
jgi:hypothetical protein